MPTIVAFHAHPDDEALLTGGTLARAAATGDRVVIVVATDGLMGAVPEGGSPRLDELRASAAILGAARVVHLGYADSGHGKDLYPDPPDRRRFVRADTEEAAERLAAVLRDENADMLLTYDVNGGYGHRDHAKVHAVGKRAAELAAVPRILEATMPRDAIERLLAMARVLRLPLRYDPEALRTAYSPASAITHRLDVRRFARQKRAALAAHRSQLSGDGRSASLMKILTRLPPPAFRPALRPGMVYRRSPGPATIEACPSAELRPTPPRAVPAPARAASPPPTGTVVDVCTAARPRRKQQRS